MTDSKSPFEKWYDRYLALNNEAPHLYRDCWEAWMGALGYEFSAFDDTDYGQAAFDEWIKSYSEVPLDWDKQMKAAWDAALDWMKRQDDEGECDE